jgi:hypothetical protein
MKHIRWIPFAFLAGAHGFAIFAPYAAVMLLLAISMRRNSAPVSAL